MITWALTYTAPNLPTVIGTAPTIADAQIQLIKATRSVIRSAGPHRHRYTMIHGGRLFAVIQTGRGADGLPDHHGTEQILDRLRPLTQGESG